MLERWVVGSLPKEKINKIITIICRSNRLLLKAHISYDKGYKLFPDVYLFFLKFTTQTFSFKASFISYWLSLFFVIYLARKTSSSKRKILQETK